MSIFQYAEVFKGLSVNFNESKPPKNPLEVILSIAFLAVLGNCNNWGEIADFGNDYKKWLSKFLPIGKNTPINDTYRRVFSLLDSNELTKATIN